MSQHHVFRLDPRLEADGPSVGDLPLCHVRLVDDARFFWVVLVPRRVDMVEIIDLPFADRLHLIEEIAVVSAAVKTASDCAKLNVATLGNVVPQLHLHVVGRNPGDVAWPGPVFGVGTREPLSSSARDERLAALRTCLAIL
ncbi:HIT domain-containing protein [Xanthobacter oligotrophicus]|uniref:HIT domain-containing protein n=1 Tax=Xanthobacter oligotrophicus TaxID=2607286 RepID=A0ABW6ZY92_9HYPH